MYVHKHKTLYETFFEYRNVFTDVFMMMLGAITLAVMANIRIPLWPVPITMQTFGIFLIAFFFGSRKGIVTILLYIISGVLGFGVFAGYKSGFTAIIGPTGGYIIGFIAMVFVVGKLIEKGFGRTKKSVLYCMIVGEVILLICGLTGLYFYLGIASIWKVLMLGFVPFIIGDVIKIAMAIPLYPYLFKKGT